jgi:hypothetical protein
MYFCVRDDDTSFFTSPDDLDRPILAVAKSGPANGVHLEVCVFLGFLIWGVNDSSQPDTQSVGEHLRRLIERAKSDPRIVWRSVGDILACPI